jgi:hypothetical protein
MFNPFRRTPKPSISALHFEAWTLAQSIPAHAKASVLYDDGTMEKRPYAEAEIEHIDAVAEDHRDGDITDKEARNALNEAMGRLKQTISR